MDDSLLPKRWTTAAAIQVVNQPNDGAAVQPQSNLKSVLEFTGLIRRHWLLVGVITAISVAMVMNQIRKEVRLYAATAVIRLADKARELSSGIARTPGSQPFRPFMD